jgi:hypothetical protein
MLDPPVLSESTKRKLALQWEALRETQDLTDADLCGYDLGRRWLLGTRAKPLRRMNLGGLNTSRPQQAARWLGLDPSVRAAEARFRFTDSEYWPLWCSSSLGHEAYRDWLESVTRQILAAFAIIWKGRSDVTDRWFEDLCAPAIEKALAVLVKQRIAQARDVEVQRLVRAPSAKTGSSGNPLLDEMVGHEALLPGRIVKATQRQIATWRPQPRMPNAFRRLLQARRSGV